MQPSDHLWTNISLATMASGGEPYGLVADAALAIVGDTIAYAGPRAGLPAELAETYEAHDGAGGVATPGLIDCHTHLIHGGNRAHEFERRLHGASYADIARDGGGILATVRATRILDEAALVAAALPRLDALMAEGVTTIEVKSGYGLELDSELRLLRAARALDLMRPVDVRTTLLAAHAVPPDYQGRADDYVALICEEIIPAVAAERLADAVDAFCEGIAFTLAQTERVFAAARRHGLSVKLHAEQLSNTGGAILAARMGALSADHLEYLDAEGIAAMAEAGTVAVLLPGAYYTLRQTQPPPVALLREAGVPMALATDCNPGTSPLTSPLLAMNMACTLFRLTPEEALAGMTRNAARALGLSDRGVLAAGMRADLAVWQVEHPAELAYALGLNPCVAVVRAGRHRKPRA